MLTLILLATCVPVLAGVTYLAIQDKMPHIVADVRGIALQTVIIVVVLLAVAGAVAGVLISRGREAVSDLESQDIGVRTLYTDSPACILAGFSWNPGADGTAGTADDFCE